MADGSSVFVKYKLGKRQKLKSSDLVLDLQEKNQNSTKTHSDVTAANAAAGIMFISTDEDAMNSSKICNSGKQSTDAELIDSTKQKWEDIDGYTTEKGLPANSSLVHITISFRTEQILNARKVHLL